MYDAPHSLGEVMETLDKSVGIYPQRNIVMLRAGVDAAIQELVHRK